jgi:PadR family transcriptional regulator, regulatory protein AphA
MKGRPSSFFVLGMLRFGARSGYAIKKATDVSMRFFWPTSLAQVYPELSRLEQDGLVTRHDDSQGARVRSAYEVTEDGEVALLEWLRSPREAAPRFRDEGMLRLYFADALSPDERLQLVRRLRRRVADFEAELRTEILPLAEGLAEIGTRFPGIVARFGVDSYAFALEWLDKLEGELEEELRQPPARRSAAAPRP